MPQMLPPMLQIAFGLYFVATAMFIVSENRSPQSSFAWMFAFVTLPVIGLVAYGLFGRDHKGFSRRKTLCPQNVPPSLRDMRAGFEAEHAAVARALAQGPSRNDRALTLIHNNTHSLASHRNRVDVLQNADQTYPALLDAMRAARSSIHLHYYSWASDTFGEELKQLLSAKVTEGVAVRILYDPVGSFRMLSWRYIRAMRAAGIEMRPFSPLWRLHTISYRNHRKIVVVDGRIGFTGGLNIGDEHRDPPDGFALWRDTHIRVEGSAARALQGIFVIDWLNATQQNIADDSLFPAIAVPQDTDLPVQICLSGPDADFHAIQQTYFQMIASARRSIRITSPFFILDDTIAEALTSAALSGVDVRVMISARGPGQYVPYWAGNTFAAQCAEAGVTMLMYDGGYLHAKTVAIDGEYCAIGSANMDIRSFSINYELTAVIYDAGITASLGAAFDADEADCTRFDADAYADRPRLSRFRDSLARLASPLL